MNAMKQWVVGCLLIVMLSACSGGGAVVFAPTDLPPEAVPNEYSHPSGAFSVLLPRTWTLFEQTSGIFASATFAPPDADMPLVQIAVINIGYDIASDELGDIMTRYQTDVRPDVTRYTEQSRQAMGDGSWRLSGVRQTTSGNTEQVNTFIQSNQTLFSVLDVTVPVEASLQSQIQTIINTFSLANEADLPVSDLPVLSGIAQSQIQIVNLSTWTTATGVFYVSGEITNSGAQALTELPVRAQLLNQSGEIVADATSTVMGYGIASGGFAPFSVRFGQGQPVNAVGYTVSIGDETYTPVEAEIIGFPILQWEDGTQTTDEGAVFVTGTVTNTGDEGVLVPRAMATLFDSTGRVIGSAFADADTTQLDAGETANFNVLISEVGGAPSNYVVNVQALPCDASCE